MYWSALSGQWVSGPHRLPPSFLVSLLSLTVCESEGSFLGAQWPESVGGKEKPWLALLPMQQGLILALSQRLRIR